MTDRNRLFLIVSLCILCGASQGFGEVRVAHIFDDNMVLQRDRPIRVWGWADAGERVTVSFSGQSKPVMADAAGRWETQLEPVAAASKAQKLVVNGNSNLSYRLDRIDEMASAVRGWIDSATRASDAYTLASSLEELEGFEAQTVAAYRKAYELDPSDLDSLQSMVDRNPTAALCAPLFATRSFF